MERENEAKWDFLCLLGHRWSFLLGIQGETLVERMFVSCLTVLTSRTKAKSICVGGWAVVTYVGTLSIRLKEG